MFWTYSVLVRQYISNIKKSFQAFVDNSVSLIRELSASCQRRHAATLKNPATHFFFIDRVMTPTFMKSDERRWLELSLLTEDIIADPAMINCSTVTVACGSDVPHKYRN